MTEFLPDEKIAQLSDDTLQRATKEFYRRVYAKGGKKRQEAQRRAVRRSIEEMRRRTPEERQQIAKDRARKRLESTTPERRKEIARNAARARWEKR